VAGASATASLVLSEHLIDAAGGKGRKPLSRTILATGRKCSALRANMSISAPSRSAVGQEAPDRVLVLARSSFSCANQSAGPRPLDAAAASAAIAATVSATNSRPRALPLLGPAGCVIGHHAHRGAPASVSWADLDGRIANCDRGSIASLVSSLW
jgi:hypothetical protein